LRHYIWRENSDPASIRLLGIPKRDILGLASSDPQNRKAPRDASLEAIASNGHPNSIDFGLAGTHGTEEVGVGYGATSRDLVRFDKHNGVLTDDGGGGSPVLGKAVSAAPPFIGEGVDPSRGIRATKERVDCLGPAGGGVIHFAGNLGVMLDGLRQMRRSRGIETTEHCLESGTGTKTRC
jgi:hypothetical protein